MSETRNIVRHYGLNQNCTLLLHPSKVIWGKERVAKEKLAGIELILNRSFRQLIFHDKFYVGLISRKKKLLLKIFKIKASHCSRRTAGNQKTRDFAGSA